MTTDPRLMVPVVIFLSLVHGSRADGPPPRPDAFLVVNNTGYTQDPLQWGTFFDEVNHAGEGGLYGELVADRCFKDAAKNQSETNLGPWQLVGKQVLGMIDTLEPLNDANPVSLRLTLYDDGSTGGIANPGYNGIAVVDGAEYNLSMFVKGDASAVIHASLESPTNESIIYAAAQLSVDNSSWAQVSAVLKAKVNGTANGRLVLRPVFTDASNGGRVWMNVVSLFPPTFKQRPNGMRNDVAQVIADLSPSFFRFPGGEFVEGGVLADRFKWNETIGPISERPGHFNDVWGYWCNDGLGFHEFLQFAEDIKAIPVFVVNAGISLSDAVHGDELDSYIRDTLDALDYANAPTTNDWGKLRAANGHPEPFGLAHIGIGNQDCGSPYYSDNYQEFYTALVNHNAAIVVIADCNESVNETTSMYDYSANNTPGWFADHGALFDKTDRSGPQIFVSSYAATGPKAGHGNLLSALSEAVFMAGLERNSDIVTMASRALLIANMGYFNTGPTLVGVNATALYRSPSYWVQHMFSTNQGQYVLPLSLTPSNLTLAATASRLDDHTFIIKIVNVGDIDHTLEVSVQDFGLADRDASLVVLRGKPGDENSLDNPNFVAPRDIPVLLELGDPVFTYTAPAYSLSVIRFRAGLALD